MWSVWTQQQTETRSRNPLATTLTNFHGVITATAPNCGSNLHPVFRPRRLSLLQRSSREDPKLPLRCFPANKPENRSVLVLFLPLVTWDFWLTRDFHKLELQNKKLHACLVFNRHSFSLIFTSSQNNRKKYRKCYKTKFFLSKIG